METAVAVILIVLVIVSWKVASEKLSPLPKATQVGRKGHPASQSRNAWPSHPLPHRLPLLPDSHHTLFPDSPQEARGLGKPPQEIRNFCCPQLPTPYPPPRTPSRRLQTHFGSSPRPLARTPQNGNC